MESKTLIVLGYRYSQTENGGGGGGGCTLRYSSAILPLDFSPSLAAILAISPFLLCIIPENGSAANQCMLCGTHSHHIPRECVLCMYV